MMVTIYLKLHGFTNYAYFVSICEGTQSDSRTSSGSMTYKIGIRCFVDQDSRRVTAEVGLGIGINGSYNISYWSATANYIEIAWN